MKTRSQMLAYVLAVALPAVAAWQVAATKAQGPLPAKTRFDFQVVESFDAKYLGDTPGHVGRAGGLGGKPRVALGDPVFRGDHRVGKVTNLVWDRTRDSLVIEFDPEDFAFDIKGMPVGQNRISVGEDVWIRLDGQATAPPAPR